MKNLSIKLMLTGPDDVDHEALKVRAAGAFDESELVDVTAVSVADEDEPYTVVGVVKGKPSERWERTVYAQSATEAEAKVTDDDPKATVAAVLDAGGNLVRNDEEPAELS